MTLRGKFILAAAALALAGATSGAVGSAETAANAGRAKLRDCLRALPAERLSDEAAIAACLAEGQRAAETEDKRQGQIEFQRRIDDLDRMIERTTRGSRRP